MATIKFEDVKKDIESAGWTLVSETYKNLNTGLDMICPNQHQINMTYQDWRDSPHKECPICARQPFKKVNEKSVKKKGYRILALDQSTHISGWSVFEKDQLINYGTWETPDYSMVRRISEVKTWLGYMLEKFSIDSIVLEDIQFQDSILTFKTLAQLQGVLENFCYEKGMPCQIVPPATWRDAARIKGKHRIEKKKNAQIKVKDIFDVDAEVDAAEAILIGRWAAKNHEQNDLIDF